MRSKVFCAVVFALAASCGTRSQGPQGPSGGAQSAPIVEKSLAEIGLDSAAIDRSADPCQDFYQYACGNWLKNTPIPGDKARWSRSFDEITDRNLKTLRAMVEDAAKNPGDDPNRHKVGSFYGACMNEDAVEKAGLSGVKPLVDGVKKVSNARTLAKTLGDLHHHRIFPLFALSSTQDARDATRVIGQIHQNGLGLPDRDYYLSDDAKMKSIREKYLAHVEKMLTLAGMKPQQARKAAADVMAIETELARAAKPRVELRDPEGIYNRIERKGLAENAPGFAWNDYFAALDQPSLSEITVTSVPYVQALDKIVKKFNWDQWRNYLTWQILDDTAGTLPKAFVEQDFTMTRELTGQETMEDRWKRCLRATDTALGDALAQMFVKEKFGPEAKSAVETMVAGIRRSFTNLLGKLDWMDDATRERAKKKLDAMVFQIGYPAKWRSYTFQVRPDDYAANSLDAAAFESDRVLAKIGKPVDRDDWYMSAPTVNAYYDPSQNVMVFPAGILQPPFFNAKAPFNVNLGAMGMVVGHELTHGFDDEGSQYDADGNLKSWWEKPVRAKFDERAQCVVKQYDKYEALPGLNLNGKLTLGENIADVAGLKLAFATHRDLQKDAREIVKAEGFNPDQQFFLSTAQMWCTNIREAAARQRVLTDPHSASRYRVNGPLSNLSEFGDAFSCKPGSAMRPENTCTVW